MLEELVEHPDRIGRVVDPSCVEGEAVAGCDRSGGVDDLARLGRVIQDPDVLSAGQEAPQRLELDLERDVERYPAERLPAARGEAALRGVEHHGEAKGDPPRLLPDVPDGWARGRK